jgi:hypothetical protein
VTTSIADQSTRELGGRTSILTRQRRDHVELGRLISAARASEGDEQQEVLRRLCRLVFPHAFAEESVLFPAVRRLVPDAGDLALHIEQEHQQVNELMTRLERSRPGDQGRDALLEEVFAVLLSDARDEEDRLLPRLQQHATPSQLRRIGVLWELVRRTAPTRAHPVVARRPPGNVLAALPLTLTDRTRDALDAAALRGPAPTSGPLRRLSLGVAALAGRIEHLPPLRCGEDPSTHRDG